MGWSGNGYGFSAVPRIGTVVQVSYLNGDIDRPIITGCTYDGRNAPLFVFLKTKHAPRSALKPIRARALTSYVLRMRTVSRKCLFMRKKT
ncbi:phage baseplate assembly protein V [Providencia stuartii]|uniref:phage baseplate assembly protein V n=1 Tax=Providencia stuartii TaxID=588 RepID=UPI004068BDBD